jgi:hypothetical protein
MIEDQQGAGHIAPWRTGRQITPVHGRICKRTFCLGNRTAQLPLPVALLAVTGTGAFFGVLRYPVALFFSTVQITNSKSM